MYSEAAYSLEDVPLNTLLAKLLIIDRFRRFLAEVPVNKNESKLLCYSVILNKVK